VALIVEPRFRKRIPCRVWVGKSSYSGTVINLSRQGMFVQTRAGIKDGDPVDLKLRGEIHVQARVIWQKRVPLALRGSTEGGVGLNILGAHEGYYHLLAEAAGIRI
jgi:hypothetical protein